ncbi:MAG: TolC family protein, partial [Rubrivivax sp.]|nr:TolC family protein [Rubrivivax sp.]
AGSAAGPQAGLGLSATQGRSAPGAPVAGSASLGVQAAWEIDLFGGLAAARDAAQARLEAAQALWHDARAAVAAETATSYLALRACEAQREQTALDAASRAETARLSELSARAGFTAPADAALARAGAARARSQLGALRAQCDTLVKSLVELTDLPEPDLRRRLAPASAALPAPPVIAPATVPAAALAQRPDVFAPARAVVAAAGDRADAQARERPQLSLSGNLAQTTLRSGGDTVSGLTWSFGPLQVVFPVLDGGSRAAASAAAQAGYDEAVALYRAQVRRAVREVEAALVALHATAERSADARLAAAGFEASLRATAARQQGGLASLFELEESRRNAVAAQIALIELQREDAAAWIALYRALGGGWREGAALSPPPGVAAAGTPAATTGAGR